MRTLLELRRDCGNCVETRAVHGPDGLIRMIVMHPAHWRALDDIVAHGGELTLNKILKEHVLPTSYCSDNPMLYDENVVRENLMYCIHRYHQNFVAWRDNIANEDWDNRHLMDHE